MDLPLESNLTGLDARHLFRLRDLRKQFLTKNTLSADGSFFQTTSQLCRWFKCTKPGLIKSRKRLIEAGLIRYTAGGGQRAASHYWVLDIGPSVAVNKPQVGGEKQPLDPDILRNHAKSVGKDTAIKRWLTMGYGLAELEACFGPAQG